MPLLHSRQDLQLAIAFFAVLLAFAAFDPPELRAQDFEPDLGLTLEWTAPRPVARVDIPAGAPEATRYPMPAEEPRDLLDQLPERPFHVVDPPPQNFHWWKLPIYTLFGFPRDLIDSLFGVVSFIPIVNLPLVWAPYELVPLQGLMRDPRDWHRWPGTTNRKGHGFLPAKSRVRTTAELKPTTDDRGERNGPPRLNETWGFFPSAREMSMHSLDEARLARYNEENEQMRLQLQLLNGQIDARNRTIADRQRLARQLAVTAIDSGDGLEATSLMLPYHLAYPGDEAAQALLINALAMHATNDPSWQRSYLWRHLNESGERVVRQSETLIRKSADDFPTNLSLAESLVFIRTRIGQNDQALIAAERAFRVDPADPRRARLYFETALSIRDREKTSEALAAFAASAANHPDLGLMQIRAAMLEGRAGEIRGQLAQLAADNPENSYFHYYLGCAELSLIEDSTEPEKAIQNAFGELERASLGAETQALRERVGFALSYARRLAAQESRRGPRPQRGLIEFPR